MTSKSWLIAAACGIVALTIVSALVLRGSDEDRIRAVLVRFAKAVRVKPNDTLFSRNARLKSELKDLVDDDVRVDIDEIGIGVVGRPKLVEDVTKVGVMYGEASCDLDDITIRLDESKTTAKVDALAIVKTQDKSEKRDVHMLLRKDGAWRITTLEVMSPRAGHQGE